MCVCVCVALVCVKLIVRNIADVSEIDCETFCVGHFCMKLTEWNILCVRLIAWNINVCV